MLRLGNTKAAAKDSTKPLIRLQKNGMKFTLGALSMLNLQIGDYVDVGYQDGSHWLTVTGREDEDGNKPAGKKVGKGNTFSSSAILGALRGESTAEDVAYEITHTTMEAFDLTWYQLALESAEQEPQTDYPGDEESQDKVEQLEEA